MKRIILTTSLFFCLAITTVLAQVTPDGSTNTSTTDSGGVILINIAAPDTNGISNNTYSEFNVPASGVSLNNEHAGNPNFAEGDLASIIVNQVTSSNPSLLEGLLSIQGGGASIIIANPNGITCNGCRLGASGYNVDLVTGTYNIATRTYDSISDNDITVGSGGLETTGVDLNIQTNNLTNSGHFTTSTVNLSLAGAFNNNGTIYVGRSFDESVDGFNITATDFTNSGTITVTHDNFNATVGTFSNESGATIVAPGGCNVVYITSYTDAGTSNCISSIVGDTIVIDIAEPNSNGLSDNLIVSFDVNARGTILNNSASGGTAQLGTTTVTGNGNITTGSEASLILFQITGSTVSDLGGTIEVFGTEAGLIIANPNGIDCDGCGFINANRVDLVTGSNYDFNTNTFGSIAAADIDIASSGLDVAVLKVQTGADFTNAGAINANTVTIEVTNFANDIENTGTISSASLNFILTNDFTHSSTSFSGFNNFSNLAISTDGTFTNTATINPTGNTAITANSFINTGGVVNTGTFNLSVAGNFDYADKGTITTTNALNLNVDGNFSNNDANNDFTWNANDTLIVLGTANIVAADFNNSGTITVTNSSFDITATDFTNNGTISANTTLNTTVSSTAGGFNNTGGVLNADTFALSVVAGDFDYIAEYLGNGTITTNTLNLNVGGDFSYNDSASNLDWGDSDILTVSGTANIVAAGFNNSGTISAVGGDFTFSESANNFIWRANDTLTVSGSANITAASFNNSGTIDVDNSFNATVATFINQSGATITAFGECNIVATTSSDNGTINCLDFAIEAMVFNIATPNSNGLSDNQVDIFDVSTDGTILNNSAVVQPKAVIAIATRLT